MPTHTRACMPRFCPWTGQWACGLAAGGPAIERKRGRPPTRGQRVGPSWPPDPQPQCASPGPPPHTRPGAGAITGGDLVGAWRGLQLSRSDPTLPQNAEAIESGRLQAGGGLSVHRVQPPSRPNVGIPSAMLCYRGKACWHTFADGELTTFRTKGGISSCCIPPH